MEKCDVNLKEDLKEQHIQSTVLPTHTQAWPPGKVGYLIFVFYDVSRETGMAKNLWAI